MADGEVRHVPERRRFEIVEDGERAILTYELRDGAIVFTHTIVPREIEGRGIGSRLARTGLDHARAEGLRAVPQCPFVAAWIERHPDYSDLVD